MGRRGGFRELVRISTDRYEEYGQARNTSSDTRSWESDAPVLSRHKSGSRALTRIPRIPIVRGQPLTDYQWLISRRFSSAACKNGPPRHRFEIPLFSSGNTVRAPWLLPDRDREYNPFQPLSPWPLRQQDLCQECTPEQPDWHSENWGEHEAHKRTRPPA